MALRYGRGYRGERVISAVPLIRGNRMTLIGAVSVERVVAALYGEWAANGEIFLHFIEKCLCPVLKKGNVVVMDNVAFHKISGIKEAIHATGARLIYLPPYSPDLNPIENMWGKIKHYLRKMAARTLASLHNSIQATFKMITSSDLQGWFKHTGYENNGSIF
jgi:transposase